MIGYYKTRIMQKRLVTQLMWAFWFENDKASFKQREEASKQIRLTDWTIRKKFKFHYKSLTFEKRGLAFGKCCCKKNGFFFSFFRFFVSIWSWSTFQIQLVCSLQKAKAVQGQKQKKSIFSKKNLEKRFHDNKKSLSDEKHVFTNKMNSRTLTLFRSQIFAEKKEDFNVTLMMI